MFSRSALSRSSPLRRCDTKKLPPEAYLWSTHSLSLSFFLFSFCTLHNIQLTPQKLSAWRKNHPGAPGAGVWPEDQVLHRGRKPGRRRYQEVLLPCFQALAVYASFPRAEEGSPPSFEEAVMASSAAALLTRLRDYSHPLLADSLVTLGRRLGVLNIEEYICALDAADAVRVRGFRAIPV